MSSKISYFAYYADLHISKIDERIILFKFENQLICIFNMAAMGYFAYQDQCKQSLVANIHQIFTKFLLSTLRWITLCEFENQLICISKMAAMSLML